MDSRADELIKQGDHYFTKKQPINSLHQEIALHFYPERADFTLQRSIGQEYADHLMTSYPVMVRRDLGDAIAALMRPSDREWFKQGMLRDDREDDQTRAWLEYADRVQRRAMYDPRSQFVKACKEADHDFAAFGQAVIGLELSRDQSRLLYRCWHLRDTAWAENVEGVIDTVHRKWKPTARDLAKWFGQDKIDPKVKELLGKEPYKEIECRHIVLPRESYDELVGGKKIRQPFVSIYIDVEHGRVMEEVGSFDLKYVIPRWKRLGPTQYALSPATMIALPEARLLQAMTLTLLNAGEKNVDPPLIAPYDMIRGDVDLQANGVTYYDSDYDERTGEVLRPIQRDMRGMPYGLEQLKGMHELLSSLFYLDKLTMPQIGENPEMTAFEVGQRIEQHIRQTLPLFEPVEQEYNAGICNPTFDLLLRGGAFGPRDTIPRSLMGQRTQFQFDNPLRQALDAVKAQKAIQAVQLTGQVATGLNDPSVIKILDSVKMLRDALKGAGTPQAWMLSDQQMSDAVKAAQQKQAAAEMLDSLTKGSVIAANAGNAAKGFAAAGAGPVGQAPAAAA